MSQLSLAILAPTLNDLSCCHGIGEGMVGHEIVKLLALLGLDLIREFTDFILLLSHGAPPVGGIRTLPRTEDSEGRVILGVLGIRLLLAQVDGVVRRARCSCERAKWPIVRANLEDQHRFTQQTNLIIYIYLLDLCLSG